MYSILKEHFVGDPTLEKTPGSGSESGSYQILLNKIELLLLLEIKVLKPRSVFDLIKKNRSGSSMIL